MEPIIVFVTASGRDEAEAIARALLEKRLAACCNCISGVRSLYWWQGKIEDGEEVLLVIKTRRDLFAGLEAEVKARHSYSVPEILAIPVVEGHQPYLQWINSNISA